LGEVIKFRFHKLDLSSAQKQPASYQPGRDQGELCYRFQEKELRGEEKLAAALYRRAV
jgi:hypothetical protein